MEDAKKVKYSSHNKKTELTRMRDGKKMMKKGAIMEDKGEDLMYKYGSMEYRAEQDAKNPKVKEKPEDAMGTYGSKKAAMAIPEDAMDTYGSEAYKSKRKRYASQGGK